MVVSYKRNIKRVSLFFENQPTTQIGDEIVYGSPIIVEVSAKFRLHKNSFTFEVLYDVFKIELNILLLTKHETGEVITYRLLKLSYYEIETITIKL